MIRKCHFIMAGLLFLILAQSGYPNSDPVPDEWTGRYEFYIEGDWIFVEIKSEDNELHIRINGDEPWFSMSRLSELRYQFKVPGQNLPLVFTFAGPDQRGVMKSRLSSGETIYEGIQDTGSRDSLITVEALIQDLDQLQFIIESEHPAWSVFTDSLTFDSLFRTVRESITQSMTAPEFYRLVAPLVARIGCGHTHIDLPGEFWDDPDIGLFPLRVAFVNGDCIILGQYSGESDVIPGSRIIAINEHSIHGLLDRILPLIPADGMNPASRLYILNQRFPTFLAMAEGIFREFHVKWEDPQGRNREGDLESISMAEYFEGSRRAVPHMKSPLLFKILENADAGLMTIKNFGFYQNRDEFYQFVDGAFQSLRTSKIEKLILDLRGNSGGDPFCTTHLLSYLEKEPIPYFAEEYPSYKDFARPIPRAENPFEGDLIVLIDGGCFSSTGHLTSLLRYHSIGTFIGTETGGTYTCNDASRSVTLKNTRLRMRVARHTFTTAVKNMIRGRGVMPHFEVSPSANDLITGRDPELEFALEMSGKSK